LSATEAFLTSVSFCYLILYWKLFLFDPVPVTVFATRRSALARAAIAMATWLSVGVSVKLMYD